MIDFLLKLFTWWNGHTIGTMVHTRRNGELVGHDEFGNAYYRTKGGAIDPTLGVQRRWVIYAGYAEPTTIPPGWFGWMHHRTDVIPSRDGHRVREWELPHQPNLTGTPGAYRPKGSILGAARRASASSDYQAWQPK
jgi:NADH:ubiquinone oxidoreductase subunit